MASLLKKIWKIKIPYENIPIIDRVIKHRSFDLKHELTELHSPWLMKDMKKAVERIQRAIKDQERIMIFGDYDVDGVCGASILYKGLRELGANVSVRLPHREHDGYGLNIKTVKECQKLSVKLLITVDCGISNVKEANEAMQLGIDLIVTDHHAIPKNLPRAFAILNPKQKDCEYPEKEIVGAVVGLKLISALNQKLVTSNQKLCSQYLDLAAIATVADCAPLRGENRLIVKLGLEQLRQTRHRGLRKLLESYSETSNHKPATSYHLGFLIAPAINAAGRLEDPLIAFHMMMGDESKAIELKKLNESRQAMVKIALEEAVKIIEQYHKNDQILIFKKEDWAPGIIGLIAGKISELYHKPAIAITVNRGKYIGSCRSIQEINIVETLRHHEDLFLGYGGHSQAAGFSIDMKKFDEFRDRLQADIKAFIKENPIEAYISVDTEIMPKEISPETSNKLTSLEPFGIGNPKPKFLLKNVNIEDMRIVGSNQKHLQFQLFDGVRKRKGIAFHMAEHEKTLQQWKKIDLICQLLKNEWNGKISIDIQMIDARKSRIAS